MTEPLRVLSLIPPMTQLNTPYPATAYLTGFLRSRGIDARQADLALALVLRLFSAEGLQALREAAALAPNPGPALQFHRLEAERIAEVTPRVLAFLQGRDSTLAHRINSRAYLPEGPRFAPVDASIPGQEDEPDPMAWAFGTLGAQDRAKHLATLFLNDLADAVREALDPRFEFVRYAESLAMSQPHFDPLAEALAAPPTVVDRMLEALALETVAQHAPQLVLLSCPFPGSVYGAFRIAQAIKRAHPTIKLVLGGGYVNTELRELAEPRVFDFFDFVTLDAGERVLLALIEHLQGQRSVNRLVRTFVRDDGAVRYVNGIGGLTEPEVPFDEVGTPTWDGLPLSSYLSLLDMLNPMHRLWSDGRWNKLTVALGCYWKKCSFCDVGLDYIGRYEATTAEVLADRIEAIVLETGQTGFHFVDEAAPPKVLKALADEIIRRRLTISWWGNVRFEKTFTPALVEQLAESGCIAISGGLEVASDRLLKLMNKGVSVEQVARVTKAFADHGVLVHAYLMYGFPTQTAQDTVDALEYVRQLFEEGCIHSGFFHRFACTVHSPVGQNPDDFGVQLIPLPPGRFAKNDIGFIDPTAVDHDRLGLGLKRGLYNFMHGVGLDWDVRRWFEEIRVPKPTVKRGAIGRALQLG
ncbi:B12-binding domain-containing radical SAM protein [Inhella gelatinilytica]|uniref:Radical SAM protein n=1 Tax=Inhella gelatinilytica TaxID=2795030 RepID=A0A931NEP7_9BURK|nr:radical SAM protein [Inhella gelatinilytica]MBH9553445.1 radical SAM protein [Inhella gelatinilytica]